MNFVPEIYICFIAATFFLLTSSFEPILPKFVQTSECKTVLTRRNFESYEFKVTKSVRQNMRLLKMVATDEVKEVKSRFAKSDPPQYSPANQSTKTDGFLPWTESIAGSEFPLTFMPFFEASLQKLISELDFEPLPMDSELALKYSKNSNPSGRIVSLNYSGNLLRKARLTYFDAGSAVQVFNMVLYPDPSLDIPIFGADLITLHQKHLAGIDFQPLYNDPIYNGKYIDQLSPIKEKYPELSQKMSARFYDSARFFSNNMLFARFESDELIGKKLYPAFTEYLDEYIKLLKNSVKINHGSFRKSILDRHAAYDQYNSERDPAHGLFIKYFGKEWSDRFVNEFLFELSEKNEVQSMRT